MHADLGHDRADELGGSHVERRVRRRKARGDLARVARLDRDVRPARRARIQRRGRRDDVERQPWCAAATARPYVPTLFATSPLAAIRSAPVSTASTSPVGHERRRCSVHDHGERDTQRVELPCSQARALEQRPRLVDPDVLDEAALPGRAHGAERRPVAARRQAARVAVRQEPRPGLDRGARPRAAPSGDSARPPPRGARAPAPASDRREARRAPSAG